MKMLTCRNCGAELTLPLLILSGKDPSVPPPVFSERQPLTERGVALKSYMPLTRSYADTPAPLEFVPQIWINPDDLTKAVRRTKNRRRLGGCCGMAGNNGPNQVCTCGAEIGTLQADCWTPLVFVAEPDTTLWIEVT